MSDMTLWKLHDGTREFLREVKEEIEQTENEITDGGLVISPALEREYCTAIGYLKGLKFLVEKLTIKNEEIEDEST
jgi:hypothetical protein